MEKRLIDYKDLSTADKIDHIWEYYKLHFIFGGIAILFIGWMLNHYIFNPPAETTLDVTVFAQFAQPEVQYELEDILNNIVVQEGENEVTVVDFLSIADNLDPNMQQATVTKMMGKSTLADYDIMIFDGEFYQNFLQEDVLLSLNDLIDQGYIKVPEDKLIKGSDVGYNHDEYYLVDITDHPGFNRMVTANDRLYLGVFKASKHLDHVQLTIDYIINDFK